MKPILLLIIITTLLNAAPAFTNTLTLRDTHGDSFRAQLKGDEYLNWFESDTGEILLFNKQQQRYEYAEIRNRRLLPSGIEKRAHTKKRLRQSPTDKEVRALWKELRMQAAQRRHMPR
ncbi:MAG: hypothetical protein DSZ03_01330 [Sulfurimonas sp.]|nr:MAG: hypothetical protein DSZ03_01330 [Sulfurimonas sp.]